MSEAKRLRYAQDTINLVWGRYPKATEMAGQFERLADNQVFHQIIKGLQSFRDGLDPIPDRDAHESVLRRVGHEFAAAEVLPRGNFLRNFLPGAVYEDYLALHGLLAARLMANTGFLSAKHIVTLYDTIDRVFRGGADWPIVTKAPAATAQYYSAFRRVRRAHNPALSLLQITRAAINQGMGYELYMVHFSAIEFITMAVTVKNCRSRVTADDGWEAAEAYLNLFEVDPLELPPLVREGRSGYEKA